MRNISCKHTVPQIEAGTKTETRRLGWKNVQRGDLLQTIVKGQGLKKGETVQKLPESAHSLLTRPFHTCRNFRFGWAYFPDDRLGWKSPLMPTHASTQS